MQPLPGWAYIVVGALVCGFSGLVRAKRPENTSMLVFFVIGVIFLLIGIFKIVRSSMANKSKSADLAALNMQASIDQAMGRTVPGQQQRMIPGQAQQPGSRQMFPGQSPSQAPAMRVGGPEMPLDPSKSVFARQDAMRQASASAAANPGGNTSASQLFPYRGVGFDPRTGHHPQQDPTMQSLPGSMQQDPSAQGQPTHHPHAHHAMHQHSAHGQHSPPQHPHPPHRFAQQRR